MKVLITGGAGYIGSFMVKSLLDMGSEVTVFDNLERGHREAIDPRATFIKGDITSETDLNNLFTQQYESAIHFAGLIAVGESEEKPDLYRKVNVEGSRLFFENAVKNGTKNFVFSSSAAVYGNPTTIPIPEDHSKNPTSEYGKNKLEVEEILNQLRSSNSSISFASLRYFNAAGAALDGSSGEAHLPETHIIPKIFEAFKNNSTFKIYGEDYKTKDGTCVRDYIHVLDLVEAHILALGKITREKGGYFYNVGTGKGYSNKEVLDMVSNVVGEEISTEISRRRLGDADTLIADPEKIKKELGFEPKFSNLKTIVESAFKWHMKNEDSN